MRKFTLLLLFSSLACLCFSQAKDTFLTQVQVGDTWQNNSYSEITFNSSCDNILSVDHLWDATTKTWINNSQSASTYNSDGKISSIVYQNWDAVNNAWVNNTRNIFEYSADGTQFVNTIQYWDAVSNVWVNNIRFAVLYNAAGEIIVSEIDTYTGTEWVKLTRSLLTYDDQKRLTQSISQNWVNGTWFNSGKTTNSYTGNNISLNYYWNGVGWTKISRNFLEYLGTTGIATKQLSQIFLGSSWLNSSRTQSVFNADTLQTASETQLWDAANFNWYTLFRYQSTYYENGSQDFSLFQLYDTATKTWVNGFRAKATNNACLQNMSFNYIPDTHAGKTSYNDQLPKNNIQKDNGIARSIITTQADPNQLAYYVRMANPFNKNNQITFGYVLSSKQKAKKAGSNNAAAIITGNTVITPNPAKDYFNITISNKSTGATILKLTDASGKVVLQKQLKGTGTQRVDLPSLQKGLYFVSIINGKTIDTQKLLIE